MANKEFQVRHGLIVGTNNLLVANVITNNVSVNGNMIVSNTTLYQTGGSFVVSTNGVSSLVVSSNTTGVLLDVVNNASNVRVFSVSDTGNVFANGSFGVGTQIPNANLHIIGTANITANVLIGGNLAIGNTSSIQRFEVVGNMAVSNFYENDINVASNVTITTGRNAMSAGPITINNDVVVTVPSGSTWTIV